MTFTYEADAEGYMIFYKGNPLGGAGIIGKYRGRKRKEQVEENIVQAGRTIAALKDGRGRKDMLDKLAYYKGQNHDTI